MQALLLEFAKIFGGRLFTWYTFAVISFNLEIVILTKKLSNTTNSRNAALRYS